MTKKALLISAQAPFLFEGQALAQGQKYEFRIAYDSTTVGSAHLSNKDISCVVIDTATFLKTELLFEILRTVVSYGPNNKIYCVHNGMSLETMTQIERTIGATIIWVPRLCSITLP